MSTASRGGRPNSRDGASTDGSSALHAALHLGCDANLGNHEAPLGAGTFAAQRRILEAQPDGAAALTQRERQTSVGLAPSARQVVAVRDSVRRKPAELQNIRGGEPRAGREADAERAALEAGDRASAAPPIGRKAEPQQVIHVLWPTVEDDILEAVFVGNPIMHHLFLDIDPTELGGAPFALTVSGALSFPARDIGLRLNNGAQVYMLPCIAGHVGADAAAVTLAESPWWSQMRTRN